MGRKTRTLIAFLVGLTCVTRGKRYADRSDQDPSTYFHAIDDNIFMSGYGMVGNNDDEEKSTVPGGQRPLPQKLSTGYKKDPYRSETSLFQAKKTTTKVQAPRIKYDASSRYNTDFQTTNLPNRQSSTGEGPPLVDGVSSAEFKPLPLQPPSANAQPLKGILRLGPRPPGTPQKRVTFRRKPAVFMYNPREKMGRPEMAAHQKCGEFGGDSGRCPGGDPSFKSTKSLKKNLRHLFYQ